MSFATIPILDLSLSRDPATKPGFLTDLRHALLEVGFLYISNTGIDPALVDQVIRNGKAFFDLPEAAKLAVQMKNAKSFLGYNLLGGEITAKKIDWREQIDISTEHAVPPEDAPLHYNLRGPNLWPSAELLPDFRPVFTEYIKQMSVLSMNFTSLIAEALELPATAFDRFFEKDPKDQQHKLKIVRYPDLDELKVPRPEDGSDSEQAQGVGPHKDSMLTTYLLQASHHRGLQAQNIKGQWIDCPPRDGTLVVAIGQGMEAITHGACSSTTHRVLAPAHGQGSRFSIPFFQGVSSDANFEYVRVPQHILEEKRKWLEQNGGKSDDVEFTFVKGRFQCLGEATFWNRCRSHEDVAERWYPEIWRKVQEEKNAGASAATQDATKSQSSPPSTQGAAVEAH